MCSQPKQSVAASPHEPQDQECPLKTFYASLACSLFLITSAQANQARPIYDHYANQSDSPNLNKHQERLNLDLTDPVGSMNSLRNGLATIASCGAKLRKVADQNLPEWFEPCSVVDANLAADASQVRELFETYDRAFPTYSRMQRALDLLHEKDKKNLEAMRLASSKSSHPAKFQRVLEFFEKAVAINEERKFQKLSDIADAYIAFAKRFATARDIVEKQLVLTSSAELKQLFLAVNGVAVTQAKKEYKDQLIATPPSYKRLALSLPSDETGSDLPDPQNGYSWREETVAVYWLKTKLGPLLQSSTDPSEKRGLIQAVPSYATYQGSQNPVEVIPGICAAFSVDADPVLIREIIDNDIRVNCSRPLANYMLGSSTYLAPENNIDTGKKIIRSTYVKATRLRPGYIPVIPESYTAVKFVPHDKIMSDIKTLICEVSQSLSSEEKQNLCKTPL
jgi:CRISPR/Cas system CSM-associated protein Csm2 small subunit